LKNTHEILSPLNEITARMPVTDYWAIGGLHGTVFGKGESTVRVVENMSDKVQKGGEGLELAPWGFVIDSEGFKAFCATEYAGVRYSAPAMLI
jgi:hypothetical protein